MLVLAIGVCTFSYFNRSLLKVKARHQDYNNIEEQSKSLIIIDVFGLLIVGIQLRALLLYFWGNASSRMTS